MAQKLQSDLGRVGIRAKLNPMDQVNLRTQFTTGKSTAVLTFWNPPNTPEEELWAGASVERVAKRVHWTPPDGLVKLVFDTEELSAKVCGQASGDDALLLQLANSGRGTR